MEVKPGKSIDDLQKSLLKVRHKLVKKRDANNDPENARHDGLIALVFFNFWNATGLLPMAQAMVIFGTSLDANDEEG